MRVRNSLGYADVPGADLDPGSSALPGTRDVFTFAPGARGGVWSFAPVSPADSGSGVRARPFAVLPAPSFFPRGGSPAPLDLPRITPTPLPIPRGTTPAPGVTRMWNVTPAIPEGYFRPTLPPGAQVPEVFTAPDGRRWFAPRPRMLPGELFWLRLLNALRGGAASTPSTSSTATAPASSALLPAYDLFQPGVFGPGDATTEDPALSKVKADESRGFPFLPVLLLGGGAFLAYRVVRGKKGAQTVKAA
jgi:hypothetical protein